MQKPFGLRPLKSIVRDYTGSTIDLIADSSDSTDLFLYDPIKTIEQTDDSGIAFCTKALPGNSIRGIIVGFAPVVSREYENELYRKAGTRRIVKVVEDPFLYIQARVNDVLLYTDIDRYINIDTGTGDTITGISLISLDYTTISDDDGQFKILQVIETIDTDTEKYTIVEGIIAKHELIKGGVIGHGFWNRISGALLPKTIGDNVNLDQQGRGIGFLDPIHDYDVVNLRFLINYINSFPILTAETVVDVLPVASLGQTAFTLSKVPVNEDSITVSVNGQIFYRNNGGTIGFTLSGVDLTWSEPNGLILEPGYLVVAWYNFIGAVPPPPVIGYWDRTGTDLFPLHSGDDVNLLQLGRGTGFLDPVDDYDVVNKRYLDAALPAINKERVIINVQDTTYYHDKDVDIAKIFTNWNTVGKVEFVVPTITIDDVGKWWEYHVIESEEIEISTIGIGRLVYQDSFLENLFTSEVGASLEVIAMRDGYFHIRKVHGNWSYTVT